MPYQSTSDLPQSVRSKYQERCQRAFIHAFNSIYSETHDDGRAMAAGHAAAQRCEKGKQMTLETIDGTANTEIVWLNGTGETNPQPMTKFKIFAPTLTAARGADGKRRLHGIASSTTRDLHGDVMKSTAIEDMIRAANNNMTIFLNHSYNLPEDVGGSVEHAISKVKGIDHEGDPNVDLEMDIVINEANPRAVQVWETISSGTKLGLSIGAQIPANGASRNNDGTYIIDHVELLETSLVSIPANPRSWVDYAVKALNPSYWETKEAARKTAERQAPVDDLDVANAEVVDETGEAETVTTLADGTEVLGAVCPSCGGAKSAPKNGCGDNYHTAAIEPNKIDATVDIHIDTGNSEGSDASPQEAQESGSSDTSVPPVEAETADGEDALVGDDVTRSQVPQLAAILESFSRVTKDLLEARTQLGVALVAQKAAETERDTAVAERTRVVSETAALLTRLADSPMVRRTVTTAAYNDFRAKFGGIYDDDILSILEKKQ